MTSPSERRSLAIPLLYGLFLLSGAAGLFYESVWSRYLGLFVGHSAYAQVVVLAIFLGGMSLGAALVARRAERIARPLFWYAIIEILVGVIGLYFHDVYVGATDYAYASLLPALSSGALRTTAVWGIAALLILPQSILLGTTFPLMSAAVLRLAPAEPGRVLGWLYFTNSLGAATGVLIAGFVLVAKLGLPGVLIAAAALNFVVGLVAVLLTGQGGQRTSSLPESPAENKFSPHSAGETRLLLWAAALTAVASFCYEINWIRMLSLVLGSATHAFELMLSAFILGLALGAFWIRRRSDHGIDPLRQLATIQIAMGLLAVATLPLYAASFHGMEVLLSAVSRTETGYVLFSLARYALCLVVMLPATFCAGMTLPLLTRTLLTRGHGEAAIGRVYAVNTLGAIVGVLLASLLLLPLLGLKTTAVLAGVLDIGIGIALLRATTLRSMALRVGAAAVAIAVAIGIMTPFDRSVLTAGVFRGQGMAAAQAAEIPYYADGRTATVSVSEGSDGFRVLSTNGKADASIDSFARLACSDSTVRRQIGGDQITQVLLGLIPLAYQPHVGKAAVIGMGSGITSHILLSDPALQQLVTVEIEPKMIEAARLFSPANQRTYSDPRSAIVIDDAKAYFAASGHQWDLVVSEPSNPWVSGVSSLFTVEFYRRVRAQLAPGGVFAQWLQTYELDDDLVLSVLAAVHEVFPDYRIHQVGGADLLLIATNAEHVPEPQWDAALAHPALSSDLCHYLPITPRALQATRLADRGLMGPALAAVGQANSDFYPVLDLRAERQRFERRMATGTLALGDEWFNTTRALAGEREDPQMTAAVSIHGMRRETQQWIRTWQTALGPVPADLPPFVVQGRFDHLRWNAVMALDQAPDDWRPWLGQLQIEMKARHAGTAGWVDTALVDGAAAFAQRHDAPAVVRDVISFRRAILAWDDAGVIRAASALMLPEIKTLDWVNGDELRDGVMTAAIRLRDPAMVRGWETRTAPLAQRARGDMRSRILAGWISAASDSPTAP